MRRREGVRAVLKGAGTVRGKAYVGVGSARMESSQLDTCSRASVAAGGTMRIQAMRQNAFGLCVRTPA